MSNTLTFFIIAGESSGDRLGAALMKDLVAEHTGDVEFVGVGGPLMKDQGLDSIFPMDDLAVMGVAEVLPKISLLFRRIKETSTAIQESDPTALITIDSPDFCFRVAKRVKNQMPSLRVIHYVAPSVWAWRPKRAAKMAQYVNHVLALLPFEPPYMEAEGMSCDFVGHPITTEPQATSEDVKEFRKEIGISESRKLLTLLPGSRTSEVTRLGPIFREVVEKLRNDDPQLAVVIPSVGARVELIEEIFNGLDVVVLDPRGIPTDVSEARKRACYKASDLALAASGTVSLELASAETPMVIAYKMHWLTAFIKRRLVRVSSATLVNILTESQSVPEFLLENCTVENIYGSVKKLMNSSIDREAQLTVSAEAMALLGKEDSKSSHCAAKSVLNFINT